MYAAVLACLLSLVRDRSLGLLFAGVAFLTRMDVAHSRPVLVVHSLGFASVSDDFCLP